MAMGFAQKVDFGANEPRHFWRRIATAEFSPAFEGRDGSEVPRYLRRVSDE